jgi:hypothetical protein
MIVPHEADDKSMEEVAFKPAVASLLQAGKWTGDVHPALSENAEKADLNIADVIGIAVKLTPTRAPSPPSPRTRDDDDPCRPDPNKDGKTDINDIAYSCQILIGGLSHASRHSLDSSDSAASDPDCEEYCARA